MKYLLLVLVALAAVALTAPQADAHPHGSFRVNQFGQVVFVPHHHVGPRFVPRGGATPFNQDGGKNRIGRRR